MWGSDGSVPTFNREACTLVLSARTCYPICPWYPAPPVHLCIFHAVGAELLSMQIHPSKVNSVLTLGVTIPKVMVLFDFIFNSLFTLLLQVVPAL